LNKLSAEFTATATESIPEKSESCTHRHPK
jgi:hypothetical protein